VHVPENACPRGGGALPKVTVPWLLCFSVMVVLRQPDDLETIVTGGSDGMIALQRPHLCDIFGPWFCLQAWLHAGAEFGGLLWSLCSSVAGRDRCQRTRSRMLAVQIEVMCSWGGSLEQCFHVFSPPGLHRACETVTACGCPRANRPDEGEIAP
jgi:hypothetical protein